MAAVILEELFALDTPIAPGAYLQSRPVGVAGSVSVAVNVSITNVNGQVRRSVLFTGLTAGYLYPARVDMFDAVNHLLTSVPTCGPEVVVLIENNSKEDITCSGWLYGVRLVP
jgi:hypothetical protein